MFETWRIGPPVTSFRPRKHLMWRIWSYPSIWRHRSKGTKVAPGRARTSIQEHHQPLLSAAPRSWTSTATSETRTQTSARRCRAHAYQRVRKRSQMIRKECKRMFLLLSWISPRRGSRRIKRQGSERRASITCQGSQPKIGAHYPISVARDKLSTQQVIPQASETTPVLASPSSRALTHLLSTTGSWVASLLRFRWQAQKKSQKWTAKWISDWHKTTSITELSRSQTRSEKMLGAASLTPIKPSTIAWVLEASQSAQAILITSSTLFSITHLPTI